VLKRFRRLEWVSLTSDASTRTSERDALPLGKLEMMEGASALGFSGDIAERTCDSTGRE
jgi:hypothetical protein